MSKTAVIALSVVLLLLLGGGLFVFTSRFARQELAQHEEQKSRPRITNTRPAADANDVPPVSAVVAEVTLPNASAGVNPKDLDAGVKLYRVSDNSVVPAHANTSGSGDIIVLKPIEPLEKNTQYKFVVTDALHDTSGASFVPHTFTFTTARAFSVSEFPAAFEKVEMANMTLDQNAFTSMAIGPDGLLYAGTFAGMIYRYEIKPDGTLASHAPVMTIMNNNGGPRLVTGIAFDPASTAENPILWVNHGQMAVTPEGKLEGADDWTGKLSRLWGKDLSEYADALIHLPRAYKDHLNFQMTFGQDGAIYFTQGSHTSVGDIDKKWGYRPERKLSAAVLRFTPSPLEGEGRVGGEPRPAQEVSPTASGKAVPSPDALASASGDQDRKLAPPPTPSLPGRGGLDVKTEEGGTYDPAAPNAPLTIYATGVRSGFDLLFHRNGHLYSGVNGAAGNEGNTPASPDGKIPAVRDLKETTDDLLIKIEKGKYYGHPNPTRGQYVLNGANPTDAKDPMEVKEYPVGILPDPNYALPAFDFGKNFSPNGLIEYKGPQFGGALDGCILVTRYSDGKDILVLRLNAEGNVAQTIAGIDGFTGFTDPLDLLQDPRTGNLYVAEYGGRKITLLRPLEGRKSAKAQITNVADNLR